MSVDEITYWETRAAEERRLADSLPDGPPALIHRQLADLYDVAVRDTIARQRRNPLGAASFKRECPAPVSEPLALGERHRNEPFPPSEAW